MCLHLQLRLIFWTPDLQQLSSWHNHCDISDSKHKTAHTHSFTQSLKQKPQSHSFLLLHLINPVDLLILSPIPTASNCCLSPSIAIWILQSSPYRLPASTFAPTSHLQWIAKHHLKNWRELCQLFQLLSTILGKNQNLSISYHSLEGSGLCLPSQHQLSYHILWPIPILAIGQGEEVYLLSFVYSVLLEHFSLPCFSLATH